MSQGVECYSCLPKTAWPPTSFNNIRVGELQGRYLTEKVLKGNYIILSGIPDIGYKEGEVGS